MPKSNFRLIVLTIISIVAGAIWVYWPMLINHFAVPIGGDSYPHIQIAQSFLDQGLFGMNKGYPPLFHIVLGLIAKLTKSDLLGVFAWATPALLFASAVSVGVFARLWLKTWLSFVVVFSLSVFVALQPFQIWQDGGFPNVLASAVFLPIGLWLLVSATLSKTVSWRPIVGYGGVLALILITHHLTTGTFIVLSLGYLTCLIAYSLVVKRAIYPNTKLLVGLLLVMIPIGLLLMPIQPIVELAKNIISFSHTFPYIHSLFGLDNPDALLPLKDIPDSLGWSIGWLGLAGLLWLWQDRKQTTEVKLLFVSWVGILLVLSQIEALRFPVRFVRELGVPATLLTGYLCISIFQMNLSKVQRYAIGAFLGLILLSVFNIKVLKMKALPDFVEFTNYDQQAVVYLASNLKPNDCVIIAPENRYYQLLLPSADGKVLSYELNADVRNSFNNLDLTKSRNWLKRCPYIVLERLANRPDWTNDWANRLKEAGFVLVVGFNGERRGTDIFSTRSN